MQYTVCGMSTLLSPAPILSRGSGIAAPNTARSRRSSLAPEFTPASSLLWEKGPSICLGWEGKSVIYHETSLPSTLTDSFAVWTFLEEIQRATFISISTPTHTRIPSSLQQHCSLSWHGLHFRVKHTRLFFFVFSSHPLSENHRKE